MISVMIWRSYKNILASLHWIIILSLISSPTTLRQWSYLLHDDNFSLSLICPELIVFAINSEDGLDHPICLFNYVERLKYHNISSHIWSCEMHSNVELFVFCFTFYFVKALRWWGVTRFAQPHVHTHMQVHSYVISTLYCLLEELQMRTFKRYHFLHNSSHIFTPKRNQLRYHVCLSQLYVILLNKYIIRHYTLWQEYKLGHLHWQRLHKLMQNQSKWLVDFYPDTNRTLHRFHKLDCKYCQIDSIHLGWMDTVLMDLRCG
jgi:hypothetical protein